jgi:hypothetical protein
VELPTLIQLLRRAAGQPVEGPGIDAESVRAEELLSVPLLAWVQPAEILITIDADEMLEIGAHLLARVQQALRDATPRQAVCIVGSFHPAPLIDLM